MLFSEPAYAKWRDDKLRRAVSLPADDIVPISDPSAPDEHELARLSEAVDRNGFAIYQFAGGGDIRSENHECSTENALVAFCQRMGLDLPLGNPAANDNGVSRIETVPQSVTSNAGDRSRYIPYSPQRLNWHTDGYYNEEPRRVRSFVLHCVRDAESGGANRLLDGEMLYLLLRDHSPRLAQALCHPETLTIPGDQGDNGSGRGTFRGPVFNMDPLTGHIYTRYTRRKHNIHWRQDTSTLEAIAWINALLDGGEKPIQRWTLAPGQGLICNNILHCRTAFVDRPGRGNGRLLLRLRFGQRVLPLQMDS